MKLSEYLELPGKSVAEFAKSVGRDPSTVARWRRGDTVPDWDALEAIAVATGREVTPDDFLSSRQPASSNLRRQSFGAYPAGNEGSSPMTRQHPGFAEDKQSPLMAKGQSAPRQRAFAVPDKAGRILIPAPMRAALGMEEGVEIMLMLVGEELQVMTPAAAMRKAQAMVRAVVPANRSLADELIEERACEAAEELKNG